MVKAVTNLKWKLLPELSLLRCYDVSRSTAHDIGHVRSYRILGKVLFSAEAKANPYTTDAVHKSFKSVDKAVDWVEKRHYELRNKLDERLKCDPDILKYYEKLDEWHKA